MSATSGARRPAVTLPLNNRFFPVPVSIMSNQFRSFRGRRLAEIAIFKGRPSVQETSRNAHHRSAGKRGRLVHATPRSSASRSVHLPCLHRPGRVRQVEHEEVLLMPRWLQARLVTFKYGLGEEFIAS